MAWCHRSRRRTSRRSSHSTGVNPMTLRDVRGEHVSAATSGSLAAYETARQQFNSYMDDPVATVDVALAGQPAVVMAPVLTAEAMISGLGASTPNPDRTSA